MISLIDNKTWLMSDCQIWSSRDLVKWKFENIFNSEESYIGNCDRCWAAGLQMR